MRIKQIVVDYLPSRCLEISNCTTTEHSHTMLGLRSLAPPGAGAFALGHFNTNELLGHYPPVLSVDMLICIVQKFLIY